MDQGPATESPGVFHSISVVLRGADIECWEQLGFKKQSSCSVNQECVVLTEEGTF